MNVYDLHRADPDIFKQFSIKDILFLYYRCSQKEKILKLHSPYNQLTFSISGKRIFHQGNHRYTVNKNSGFLLVFWPLIGSPVSFNTFRAREI